MLLCSILNFVDSIILAGIVFLPLQAREERRAVVNIDKLSWSMNLLIPTSLASFMNTVVNGHIKRITDEDIQSSVLEIMGTNVSTNFITCPADPGATLGIKLPFLVMIIKNLKKYFTFEVQVLDDKNVRRRFRASNYQARSHDLFYWCIENVFLKK